MQARDLSCLRQSPHGRPVRQIYDLSCRHPKEAYRRSNLLVQEGLYLYNQGLDPYEGSIFRQVCHL